MARRAVYFASVLLLLSGCGQSTPPTPDEQSLKYLRTGAYDKAIESCEEAIRLNPHDAQAYLYRGRAYQFRDSDGDRDRALADFSQAIRIAPKDPEAYYSRSITYRDLGNLDASHEDEKVARRLDSRIEQTYLALPDVTPAAPQPTESTDPAAKSTTDGATDKPSGGLADIYDSERATFERLKKKYEGPHRAASGDGKADPASDPVTRLLEQPRYKLPPATATRDNPGDDEPSQTRPSQGGRAASSKAGKGPRSGQFGAVPRPSPMGSLPSDSMTPKDPWQTQSPTSAATPWQPRSPWGTALQPQIRSSPYLPQQSPFPQRPARPTGQVQDQQSNGFQPYINPYSGGPVRTVHPNGAYHEDFNP